MNFFIVFATVIMGSWSLALPAVAKSVSTSGNLDSTPQAASATQTSQQSPQSQSKVHCSRTDPRVSQAPSIKLAQRNSDFNSSKWVEQSPLEVFCRDVRINTIVVRYYCTVLKE